MAGKTTPSPDLLAANMCLLALRQQRFDTKQESGRRPLKFASPNSAADGLNSLLNGGSYLHFALPDHLGWGSAALTTVLRRRSEPSRRGELNYQASESETAVTPAAQPHSPELGANVKLYPDIGLGLLRQKQTAPGRLWLLLRFLDREGRGSFRIDLITQTLTNKTATSPLCGKRQLRNLLRAGEGLFWTRANGQIWLRSAANVSAGLGVTSLGGRPVALPVAILYEGVGAFRAHLYAAFHSGRTKETPQGRQAMPMARQTLARLSGVGASSQRSYEVRTGLKVQRNFGVGSVATAEKVEESAWRRGQAFFTLRDHRGQQGRPGQRYLAWQLPNSYGGIHPHWPKGRQKRINRKLKDLVTQGTPGNMRETDEAPAARRQQRYYAWARQAVRVANRQPERVGYWRNAGYSNGRYTFWQQAGGG